MQPMLYEIGQLYADGKIPIAQEQLFSEFVKKLIREIRKQYQVVREADRKADVLLACASGNHHEFGIALLELQLIRSGLAVDVVCPGISPELTFEKIKEIKPRVLGISVSIADQLPEVYRLVEMVQNLGPDRPEVAVGGFAIRKETPDIKGVNLFRTSGADFTDWIAQQYRIC